MIPRDVADNANAARAAALYGVEIRTLVPVGGGFSGACIFKVEDSSGALFALRRTPASDAMPVQRYCELVSVLREVSSRGCSVIPVPLRHQLLSRGMSGTSVTPLFANLDLSQTRIRAGEFVWQMEPWMPGEPAQGYPTSTQLVSTLETLALFHRIAAAVVQAGSIHQTLRVIRDSSPGIGRRMAIVSELSSGLLVSLKKAADHDPDAEFRSCAKRLCAALEFWLPWLTRQLSEVAGMSYPLQPVIRDLWRPHVLFTDERVTGIIDLNAMATDHVGLDVTRLFRSWFGADVDRIRDAAGQFAVHRSLDASERRLFTVLDASTVLLSPVTWLRRRFTGVASDHVAQDVVQRLQELTSLAERFEPL